MGIQHYNLALLMNFFEHTYNHEIFLKNIHKLLKKAGCPEGSPPH